MPIAPTTRYPHELERDWELQLGRWTQRFVERASRLVLSLYEPPADDETTRADADEDEVLERLIAYIGTVAAAADALDSELERVVRAISTFQREGLSMQIRRIIGVNPTLTDAGLRRLFDGWVSDNVSLIRSIPEQHLPRVETIVADGYRRGLSARDLARRLQEAEGITYRRARLIARDQVGKLYGSITEERHQQLGIREYVWETMGDERVRPSHAARDGNRYRWGGEGPHPGEEIQCRCLATPVIDETTHTIITQQQPAQSAMEMELSSADITRLYAAPRVVAASP